MLETTPTSSNLGQRLASLSPAQRALLELRLMQKSKRAKPERQSIKRQADRTSGPLSYNQQGLWVLDRLMPGAALYHSPTAARLTGELDIESLTRALRAIVERHDGLRTTFATVDGAPRQVVNEFSLDAPLIDLSDKPESEREAEALSILRREVRRPFDLSQGPLIRAIILRMQEHDHILLVTMHHIVTDGWSVGLFHRELSKLYQAFTAGQTSPMPELPIQYLDYSAWQREWFEGEVYESQLDYWKKQFSTLPAPLELPTDYMRPKIQAHRAFRGEHQTITLSAELTQKIRQTCNREGVTLFMMLMAAYQILLHRYTGDEDIVVGTPIASRQQPETEELIGLFINTLAMRMKPSGDLTVREFLNHVKQVSLGAYAHQDLPFERLVKELQPDRTLAHNPLFQVIFVLQSEEILPLELPGLKADHFRVENVMANFDLTLDIVEKDDELVCLFESNADLFAPETIARMMQHLENLLSAIVANPAQRISELSLLTHSERRQLLVEWNETKTDYPADKSVGELFAEQVERTPDTNALIFGDDQLTYRELNLRANQLANYLRAHGVGPEVLVGVRMDRSAQLIVALLAIVKAGGAYLPLDLSYPQERVSFMLADAKVPVLLTEKSLAASTPATDATVVYLDEAWDEITKLNDGDLSQLASADNLIYVIYTSGSTGTPKGVSVTHRAVNRLVFNTNYVEITDADRIAQASNASFDAATFEIWGALLHGAQLVGVSKDVALSPRQFAEEIQRKKISVMFLTTALFNQIAKDAPRAFSSVRQLMFGGEACDPNWVREILQQGPPERLLHVYGPTESTTFSTWHLIESVPDNAVTIPIGKPLSNTETYIVDGHFNPVPVGVAGELYIGGDGLARDYLNRPELTGERFVRNPFSDDPGARLYKTGDVVCYLPDGSIEFVGRKDHQVKIRGFRIELGEIEAALVAHDGISESVVVVTESDSHDRRLTAYFVARVDANVNANELRDFLRQKLPDYMVPSSFVALAVLPLTPNGKIDRRALPAPNEIQIESGVDYSAPADELELKLARIWEKVLGVSRVGADENFFDLGGHSLLAVQLFAQIEKSFDRNLPLATLFQAPTIRQLAAVLREEGWPAPWSSLVMIQPGDKRKPFFCVHAAGGNVIEYRELARLLGTDQPFYGFQAQGLDGKQAPHTTIKEMAAHYIKEMREVQPEGPYLLGGRSSGGTIAFEMACQLHAAGQEVALLALLDTFPAGYFKLLPGAASFGQRFHRRLKKWQSHLTNLHQLNASDKVGYVFTKLRFAPAKIKHKVYRRACKVYKKFGKPLPPVLQNIEEINFAAVKDYEPQVYPGDVTLFLATDLTADYDSADGWRELVRGAIETYQIPGNHLNMIKEPGVTVLAEKLGLALDQATSNNHLGD